MDHPDVVHQTWNDLNHAAGIAFCKGAEELVQRVEVLDIVLGLVRRIRNSTV